MRKRQSEENRAAQAPKANTADFKDVNSKNINGEGTPADGNTFEAEAAISVENDRDVKEGCDPEPDKTSSENKELLEKLAEMQDRYIRLAAEFDNYRKRTLREKIDLTKYAGEKLITGLLPVADDFERAISQLNVTDEITPLKEGIILIYNKLSGFMRENGVREIESLHSEFNVDIHEAVNKITVENDSLRGKVVEVMQKGYYLNDKVIRFSKVVVGE